MPRGSMRFAVGDGLGPYDIGGTNAQTTGFWMGVNAHVTAVFMTGQTTDMYTDTACVCSCRQAQSATGLNEAAIAALAQTLGGANEQCIFDLSGEDLDTGFDYVMFRATEAANSGDDYVSITVIGTGSRYKYDGMSTYERYDSI